MIKQLILNNLVLVDHCEIQFSSSFNVVTGETGAGKTALIEAIALALGSRADSSLVRKGCDRAFVEAAFEIESLPHLKNILDEAGLPVDEFLVIRREIATEGKNRAFINCRMVPLPLLQKIGEELIDVIGQRAHQSLLHSDAQRNLVDLFGSSQGSLNAFQAAYAYEKELQKRLEELRQLSLHRERDEEVWRSQIEEIRSVGLKKDEEEAVYEKYQRLANAQEISEKLEMMIKGLSESDSAVLPQLTCFHKACEALHTFDRRFAEPSGMIQEARVTLSETLRTLQSYAQNIDNDPSSFQFLENRLSAIARLKRKYGATFEEIEAYHAKVQTELSRLENLSDDIQTAESIYASAGQQTAQAAQKLTSQRKESASNLQKILTSQLQSLNMKGAEVSIEVVAQPRNSFGDDLVQFWLKANTGEHRGLVKEHSSGGELSRLLFAIKSVLAEKNNTPTLIFDEVDANVGGKTAAIMGEKLQELGKHRQVICITHFPQVASKADTHFGVQKKEAEGRTKTEIRLLSKKEREQEMVRMLGADPLLATKKC